MKKSTNLPIIQPSSSLPDGTIISALERTRLWLHFTSGNPEPPSIKARQILNASITSLPQMSTGQSQLFALARAILQVQVLNYPSGLLKSQSNLRHIMPILLLDEATSSLDPETESILRSIICQEFTEKGHTVISITHRLSGVIKDMRVGQDMVALLSEGKVKRISTVKTILDEGFSS
jgi:ATP-binding cassette, subfamily C (CFTR/MRP), member 1